MEGEFRLRQAQLLGEFTHAALAAAQRLKQLQANRLRQGLEPLTRQIRS
jgi:hypothetical protein